MSHKRYADFDDLCVDADGNEIIVLHESNSPSTCEPYVPEENVEFKYIYGKGQTYTNSKGSTQYQLIDPGTNNTEHNSSESNHIKITSSSVQQLDRMQSFTDWKEDEIKLLLKKYIEFVQNVGKDKKFKTKREMWVAITEKMNNELDVVRSPKQYMAKFFNRFQTQKKPKKAKEGLFSYHDEIGALNSLYEVIMNDLNEARTKELEIHGNEITGSDSIINQVLPRTLIELAKIKAQSQERRHSEYMKFIKSFESQFMETVNKIINNI